MTKQKLLIVSGGMEIGGIERSLLGLLSQIDYDRYDVDLLLFSVSGELLEFVDRRCSLLPQIDRCASMVQPIVTVAKRFPVIAAKRAAAKILSKKKYGVGDAAVFAQLSSYWHSCVKNMPKLNKKYDAAISFMWPHDFTAKNVDAKRKIAWIHTDYTVAEMDFARDEKVWNRFDKIAAVSDEVGEAFKKVYPKLSEKIFTAENILSSEFVYSQAKMFEPKELDKSCKTVLSVGRITHQKAFELAAQSAKIMHESGCSFKWYIIGYGPDEDFLRSEIKRLGVSEYFVLLGKRTNPYPYMAACDVYAQPSRYEGKAVTVREAQMLGKPVLITAYETSASQVENGVDGIICPMGARNVANALIEMLGDEELLKTLSKNCLERDYSNSECINAVYCALNE